MSIILLKIQVIECLVITKIKVIVFYQKFKKI